jgi:hypothetical protein
MLKSAIWNCNFKYYVWIEKIKKDILVFYSIIEYSSYIINIRTWIMGGIYILIKQYESKYWSIEILLYLFFIRWNIGLNIYYS